MDFPALLDTFARAIERRDGNGLADLSRTTAFTMTTSSVRRTRGVPASTRLSNTSTRAERTTGGSSSLLASERLGYASYWFSYDSTLPEASGARVVFGGMSRFELDGGRIKRYSETFDRGMALAQVGFAPERLKKLGLRYAEAPRRLPAVRSHLRDD